MYFVLPSKFIFSECFRCCHPMTFYSLDLIVVEAENTHARCMYSKKSQDFGYFFLRTYLHFPSIFPFERFYQMHVGKLHSTVNIKSRNDIWKILWFWSNSQNVKASRKFFDFDWKNWHFLVTLLTLDYALLLRDFTNYPCLSPSLLNPGPWATF